MFRFFLIIVVLLAGTIYGSAQKTASNYAAIQLSGERNSHTRTYLCTLKKGDLYQLENYLQSGTAESTEQENKTQYAPKEYAPRSDRNETRYLSETYNIDEKKLKEGGERYNKKYFRKKKKAWRKKSKEKPQKLQKSKKFDIHNFIHRRTHETTLSKQFKFKSRRIKAGKEIKYPAGSTSLLIKYEVHENNKVKTYLTSVKANLVAGKKYELKYYGNNSRRKYFLVYIK